MAKGWSFEYPTKCLTLILPRKFGVRTVLEMYFEFLKHDVLEFLRVMFLPLKQLWLPRNPEKPKAPWKRAISLSFTSTFSKGLVSGEEGQTCSIGGSWDSLKDDCHVRVQGGPAHWLTAWDIASPPAFSFWRKYLGWILQHWQISTKFYFLSRGWGVA